MKKLILCTLLYTTVTSSYAQTFSVLKDIRPGKASSFPANLLLAQNKLFFSADDSVHGAELWASNGTANTTAMLLDLYPGKPASFPENLIYMRGALYFSANNGISGKELWKLDLTTMVPLQLTSTKVSSPFWLVDAFIIYNNNLYFSFDDGVHGSEVWKTDGTVAGTMLVKDVRPGGISTSPREFFIYRNKLYYRGEDDIDTQALYVIDGAAGTEERVYNCGEGGCFAFTLFKDSLYFFSDDHSFSSPDMELYASDGSTAGTHIVKQINPNGPGTYFGMVATDSLLFFSADDGVHGIELWKSDGSANGTLMVKNIGPGQQSGTPTDLIAYNNKVIFRAYQNGGGGAWASDGTAAGTIYLADILVNNEGHDFIEIVDHLFFVGYIPNYGYELCVTDGTPGGTKLALDINKGTGSSFPDWFTPGGNKVFFQATDDQKGNEVFSITNASLLPVAATTNNISNASDMKPQDWLQQNSPNPAHAATSIQYVLPGDYKNASLIFTASSGRVVKTLALRGRGQGVININTIDFTSGNYFYSLAVDGKIMATKTFAVW